MARRARESALLRKNHDYHYVEISTLYCVRFRFLHNIDIDFFRHLHMIEKNEKGIVVFDQRAQNSDRNWAAAFEVSGPVRIFNFRIDNMTPTPGDIYDGKLSYTKAFFRSIASGQVTPLRRDRQHCFADAIDILTVIATHNHVARAGDFKMADPAFWTKMAYDEAHILPGKRLVPVMPLEHLISISGRSEADLNELLLPLLRDGAILIVKNRSNVHGVLLNDGYVNTARFQHMIRP